MCALICTMSLFSLHFFLHISHVNVCLFLELSASILRAATSAAALLTPLVLAVVDDDPAHAGEGLLVALACYRTHGSGFLFRRTFVGAGHGQAHHQTCGQRTSVSAHYKTKSICLPYR